MEPPQDDERKEDKPKRAKKIAIVEPHEEFITEKKKPDKKSYRKSVYPPHRESMSHRMSRKSSIFLLAQLSGPNLSTYRGLRGTSARASMYLVPRFQNTYRMESRSPFHRENILSCVDSFLRSFLDDYRYNRKRATRLAENLSQELKNHLKMRRYDRYRFVVAVTVGDKASQDFRCITRSLWDPEKDDFVSFTYEAAAYFVLATIWAIYYE